MREDTVKEVPVAAEANDWIDVVICCYRSSEGGMRTHAEGCLDSKDDQSVLACDRHAEPAPPRLSPRWFCDAVGKIGRRRVLVAVVEPASAEV